MTVVKCLVSNNKSKRIYSSVMNSSWSFRVNVQSAHDDVTRLPHPNSR